MMERVLDSHRHLELRGGQLCQITKTLTCGCMIGTAILFPLANTEALWFRSATLSIFLLTALAFHGLHIEPFIIFGPFTAPAALLLLLLAVLQPGPSRKELIPWLPLFIASFSLVTVAIHETSKRFKVRRRRVVSSVEDGRSSTWSSDRSVVPRDRSRPPSQSNRRNPLYFAHAWPPSHYSHRTGDSELALSDVPALGGCRSEWDPDTQGFFTGGDDSPVHGQHHQPVSEDGSTDSRHALLGPH